MESDSPYLPKCPNCGRNLWNIDKKDIKWIPNGHKYKMGNKMVEAVDPVPIKGTCGWCDAVVNFEELRSIKVDTFNHLIKKTTLICPRNRSVQLRT